MKEPSTGPSLTSGGTRIEEIAPQIDEVLDLTNAGAIALVEKKPEHTRRAALALWHVRGQAYHTRNLFQRYVAVAEEVGSRLLATGGSSAPEMVVIHSLQVQELLFEFYALVTLARISLDALRDLVLPLFATTDQTLPNSITGILKGSTNCHIYNDIGREPVFRYLLDVRDCLVHHKTLASGDNTVALKQGTDEAALARRLPAAWSSDPVIKAYYRRVSEDGVGLNMLLPDQIYEYDQAGLRGPIVNPFTYESGTNILVQSVEFLRFGAFQVIVSFQTLGENDGRPFLWSKARPGSP